MKRIFISTAIIVGLLCAPGAAWADEKSEAKKHFDIGFKLWEKKNFAAAAEEFEQSVKLYENKNNLYNLANCYMELARTIDALTLYRQILMRYPNDLDEEMKGDIEARIEEINASLSKLKVEVNRDHATVKNDGNEVGASPLREPLLLLPGDHEVEVVLEGYEPIVKHIATVGGVEDKVVAAFEEPKLLLSILADVSGAAVSVDGRNLGVTPLKEPLVLAPDQTYRIAVTKSGYTAAEQEVRGAAGETKSLRFDLAAVPKPTKPPRKNPVPNILFWTGISGTAACAVAGGILWGVGASKLGKYKDKVDDINSGNFADEEEESALRRDLDELEAQATHLNAAAVGLTMAAGAFAVAAVVGAVLKKTNKESPQSAQVSAVPGGIEVRF